VLDNLVLIKELWISTRENGKLLLPFDGKSWVTKNDTSYRNITAGIDLADFSVFLNSFFLSVTSCKKRLSSYNTVTWSDLSCIKQRSRAFQQLFVNSLYTFVGVDEARASAESAMQTFEVYFNYIISGASK
jgi:hypothetical protein